MNYLIIASHPYQGSFDWEVIRGIQAVTEAKGHSVACIDLVGDGFNPVLSGGELKLWGEGQSSDPLVKTYQAAIEKADVVVFPFPIWWGIMPAALKGFCDKVLLPGWAYRYGDQGQMIGLLTTKKAVVITTMQSPIQFVHQELGKPVEGVFIKNTLQACGFTVLKHIEIDAIVSGGKEHAEKHLAQIKAYFENL